MIQVIKRLQAILLIVLFNTPSALAPLMFFICLVIIGASFSEPHLVMTMISLSIIKAVGAAAAGAAEAAALFSLLIKYSYR